MARKRSVKEIIEFCGWPYLVDLIKRAKSLRDAALIATLFLTGGRISEVLSLRRKDFDLTVEPEVIVLRRMMISKRHKKIGEHIVNGEKKWITEKILAYRSFAIRKDELIAPALLSYLETLSPDDILFPFSRQWAHKIVRDLSGQWPHWFRAQRACQLAEDHDLDINSLMEFFKWRDQKTAMQYTNMGWRGLARKQGLKV